MYQPDNSFSDIGQLDGNTSHISDNVQLRQSRHEKSLKQPKPKNDRTCTALNLPTVASYNLRSLFPKVGNFKTDMIERKVDCAFVSEVWEQSEDKGHLAEIEKMLQMDGLQYISTSRPNKKRGGGVALIVNTKNFACEKLKVFIPTNVEAVWGLLTPKSASVIYKKIIVCAFYSPPTANWQIILLGPSRCW
jgi:hypothetical protein